MLSKRLEEVSKLVDLNKVVYDVGSDHGLLPCFLVKEGTCPKAYASDNKEGPLNKAKENIKRYHLEDKVIPVLCDGIDLIEDDVDIITICGMGYFTVEHILGDKDLSKYSKIIVQVNKDVPLLRKYINDHHYKILDERIVYDDFYYEIVVFTARESATYSDLEIEYGPILLKNKDELFIEYLNNRIKTLKKIYMSSNNHKTLQSIKEIEGILGYNG